MNFILYLLSTNNQVLRLMITTPSDATRNKDEYQLYVDYLISFSKLKHHRIDICQESNLKSF